MRFAIIDACPAPRSVAPYIYLVLRRAGQQASSIYRGEDARDLLHRLGKRTQAEIHRDLPAISNPAGRSQHECRSDGNANPGPVGRVLHEWEVGIDSGGDDPAAKAAIEAAAAHYGWRARHPYSRGVEGHHWCFAAKPEATTAGQKAAVFGARVALAMFPPALRVGSKGPRAQLLKRRLVRLGYLSRYVRGPLGPDAIRALKAFQKAHNMTQDGVAGPATQEKIRAALKARKGRPKPPPRTASPTPEETYARRARTAGAKYEEIIIREATKAGVQLSLAFALVEQESGFTNVFGHDPTIFKGAGKVTRLKYGRYKRQRGPTGRGGMQGVGPCQLTWWEFQDRADAEGGCWKPEANIRVGLRILAANIQEHGEKVGIERYNGSGPAAQAYAAMVSNKRDKWHSILTGGKR